MKAEISLYLRYIWREKQFIQAPKTAIGAVSQLRKLRTGPLQAPEQSYLQNTLPQLPSLGALKEKADALKLLPITRTLEGQVTADIVIPLSSFTYRLDEMNTIDWSRPFNDLEDTFILHRFGWLLRLFVENEPNAPADLSLQWILDWIRVNGGRDLGWGSYSLSERITNWLIAVSIYRHAFDVLDSVEQETIRLAIIDQAYYLSQHLELRGQATNNHLINNGRALYIFGVLFNNEPFAALGADILLTEYDHMFTPGSFLNEGSVHYHFLLLRTYLECLITAELMGQLAVAQKLRPIVSSMAEMAEFFLVEENGRYHVPLVGDVCPDFPVSWLLGAVPAAAKWTDYSPTVDLAHVPAGWHTLWMEPQH